MNPAKLWRMSGKRVLPDTMKKTGLAAQAQRNPASYCQKWKNDRAPDGAWQGEQSRRGRLKP